MRNRRDGTVEALVCGRLEQVELIVEWAKRGRAACKEVAERATNGGD